MRFMNLNLDDKQLINKSKSPPFDPKRLITVHFLIIILPMGAQILSRSKKYFFLKEQQN